ncbi:ACT domain-containing protein [Silanimonas sp.]|jgi:acetolactate synthase II small subunit|uniref:ACT domain-containing protein n=1 Tax=Silanimonas sp. TaxID=1929290 RepID=UPI0022C4FF9E|nr:ACT domain-containing protein [Silanimonas sp.]MCZ8062686.1 acetolactate synthase [Silanimonas sp.]MCZ8116156.1 acetolactate synthase [Silanimonas sp.]
MHYQLDVTLRQSEGALARVLGTAQRRGYWPLSMQAETDPRATAWTLSMKVESERSAHGLKSQLDKLHDCLAVEVAPCR